jgi:hypothetical protein
MGLVKLGPVILLCILKCILQILWGISLFLVHLLPKPMQSRLRYVSRYLSKSGQRIHPPHPHAIRLQPLRAKFRTDAKAAGLADLLKYDILVLIAKQVHYVDLINLSLVSRKVRQAVFPPSEIGARSERLRIYTCENGTKSQCWVCNIQICNVYFSYDPWNLHG